MSQSYLIRPLTSGMTKMNTNTLTKTADENIINVNSNTLSRGYYFADIYFWREAE